MKRIISLLMVLVMTVCLLSTVVFADVATGITLESEMSGYAGNTLWLQPMAEGGWDWPADLVWTTSDDTIVAVDGYSWGCDCYLLAEGTATVTVTSGELSASCVITVTVPETLELNTAKELTFAPYQSYLFSFTAEEAGSYTFYVPSATDGITGDVSSDMAYGSFSTDETGVLSTAVINLEANETCSVSVGYYYEETATCTLKVIKSPALTGYKFNKEALEIKYIEGTHPWDSVKITADPITASLGGEIEWTIEDPTIADIVYAWAGECYVEGYALGETVLTASIDGDVIATFPVAVVDPLATTEEIVWGVIYDITEDMVVYTFTPAVTDTYTFSSTSTAESTDPRIDIMEKTEDGYNSLYYFDDTDEFGWNFQESTELEAGKEYFLVVSNVSADGEAFTFTMKGTDASDPGYDVEKVAAKEATCTAEGNVEYYLCKVTGLKFTDETATRLAGDVVIEKLPHKLEKVEATDKTIAHEKCSECGALFVDGKEVTSIDNPKTGDNAMLLPMIALSVLSITGLAVAVVGKKNAI